MPYLLFPLCYRIGLKSKSFRRGFYKLTHKYLWGIISLIETFYNPLDKPKIPYDYEEFPEHIEQIFSTPQSYAIYRGHVVKLKIPRKETDEPTNIPS